jgi:ribosome maturation factor RimP
LNQGLLSLKAGSKDPLFISWMTAMMELTTRVEALAEPLLKERVMELVDLEVTRLGRKLLVRLFVDLVEGGITVEDCAELNRELSHLLDVEDFIAESYILEVSSPGLNRRLRKPRDFQRFLQAKVKVETGEKIQGRRRFRGLLIAADDSQITLQVNGELVVIPLGGIVRANLEYEFEKVPASGRRHS